MASSFIVKINGVDYVRVADTSLGHRLQYTSKLDKFTAKQWLQAHGEVMRSMNPEDRQNLTNRQFKEIVLKWLNAPKAAKASAKISGIDVSGVRAKVEARIHAVAGDYLSDFCQPEINSQTAIAKARRQCGILLDFFKSQNISSYGQMKRDIVKRYPEWRNSNRRDGRPGVASADTINKELYRMAAIIKHGVKYHGWQERYLLDGVRVKSTQGNTKSVRPFEIAEAKAIMGWLRGYAEKTGNWHLHDMALLALCAGLEAKALDMLAPKWFKLDAGILRVYDKLVSGVLDAKTQNRARDIPLTPTLRKIFERGYVFSRPARTHRPSVKGGTRIFAYSRSIFAICEKDTGIADVCWHRFRHTCATARLSAGWQLVRVSRMLGHSSVNTTAQHYAEYDLSASPAGFEGMLKVYGEFIRWLDEGYC